MLSAREQVYYEKRDNLKLYGHRKLDWEITNMVMDELAPLLGPEVIELLSPMAQMWISEHVDQEDLPNNNNNENTDARSDDSGGSDSGQTGLGESEEAHYSIGANPDSGILVEGTE